MTTSPDAFADDTVPTDGVDERANRESRADVEDRSPGVARATGASTPPPMIDAVDDDAPGGSAAGDPLAGVTISPEDAADAVSGDTGPEHPGTRPS